MPIKIIATADGPYLVGGDLSGLTLLGADGKAIDISGEKRLYLCRCGASKTKPFCDSTHTEIGFKAAEAAATAADDGAVG
jgi:CDGSH-type Zn-finger protein